MSKRLRCQEAKRPVTSTGYEQEMPRGAVTDYKGVAETISKVMRTAERC